MLAPAHVVERILGIQYPFEIPAAVSKVSTVPTPVDFVICSICSKVLSHPSQYTTSLDNTVTCWDHWVDGAEAVATTDLPELFPDAPEQISQLECDASAPLDVDALPDQDAVKEFKDIPMSLSVRLKRRKKVNLSLTNSPKNKKRFYSEISKEKINSENLVCPCGRKIINFVMRSGLFGIEMCGACKKHMEKASKMDAKVRGEIVTLKNTMVDNPRERAKEYMEYLYSNFRGSSTTLLQNELSDMPLSTDEQSTPHVPNHSTSSEIPGPTLPFKKRLELSSQKYLDKITSENLKCPCGRKIVNYVLRNGLFGTDMCGRCARLMRKGSKMDENTRLEIRKLKVTAVANPVKEAKEYMDYLYGKFSGR